MLAHQRTGGSCSPASACAHLSPPSSTGFRRFKPARSCAPCLSAADISSPSQRRAWVGWTLHPLRFSRHTVGVPSSSSSHGDSSKGWGGGQQGPGASQGWDSVSASDRAEPQHPAAAALRKDNGGMPKVPWGGSKIFQVMALWLLAYVIIGQVALPIVLTLLGIDRDAMSIRGHALLHLSLDMSQLGATLLILWQTLKSYRPRMHGFFPIKWKGWWPLAVLLGCAVFPAVDYVAHQSISWLPVEADGWGGQMEASLSMGDWITNVAYFSVVSICAPIWEEAIFRGFLLTSMTRYMPTYLAAGASSLLFAMCHFRHQTFLPLLMLGSVFATIFIKTRNLLPPIVLHSLWNIYVMVSLIKGNGVY